VKRSRRRDRTISAGGLEERGRNGPGRDPGARRYRPSDDVEDGRNRPNDDRDRGQLVAGPAFPVVTGTIVVVALLAGDAVAAAFASQVNPDEVDVACNGLGGCSGLAPGYVAAGLALTGLALLGIAALLYRARGGPDV
jgi:hypothetical protein